MTQPAIPQLDFNPSPFNERLVARLDRLRWPYAPTPWLFNAHLQLLWLLLRDAVLPALKYERTDALRMEIYDEISARGKPPAPHYYLGVIGVAPELHGRGVGTQLLSSFCALSGSDPLSSGVYLETAEESNVGFYERAGFSETARGSLGDATLWCMYRPETKR